MNTDRMASLVIHPSGVIVTVNLKPGVDHLALMYEHLDCRAIDVVRLSGRMDMWIDDEGMFIHPVNPVATALAWRYGRTWQVYHGPALLCGFSENGESIDLTHAQLVAVLTQLEDVLAQLAER